MLRHHSFVALLVGCSLLSPCVNAAKKVDTVTITSAPSGARVEVNGRFIGTTPLEWKVGNWALNPNKAWLGSKHLSESLTMTVIKEGFVPRTIQLTGTPMRWTSANGMNSYIYYVIQSTEYNLKLDKVGDFLGGNPFNALGQPTQSSGSEPSLEAMIARTMPGVVTLTTNEGSGSGFFVATNGVIVTNKHVVGASQRVRVLDAFGNLYETESIYTDPDHDLALVKVKCEKCPALTLADPPSINVGQEVVAIGSPGLSGVTFRDSVTRGIVSAFRGPNEDGHVYIQTDAQINPGNSGGPLLNKWGYAIGVNTMKVVSDGYSGLNFAISSNDMLQMLERRFQYRATRGVPPTGAPEPAVKSTGDPLTNDDVLKLKSAGLSDDLLIAKIKSAPAAYKLDTNDLINLKKANVADAVIAAMIEAQQRRK